MEADLAGVALECSRIGADIGGKGAPRTVEVYCATEPTLYVILLREHLEGLGDTDVWNVNACGVAVELVGNLMPPGVAGFDAIALLP